MRERERSKRLILGPERLRPAKLAEILQRLPPRAVAIATPQSVRHAITRHFQPAFSADAVNTLHRRRPEQSARTALPAWQRWGLSIAALGLAGALVAAPTATITALTLGLGVLFVPMILLRVAAVANLLRGTIIDTRRGTRLPDAALPVYTLLVPLFREPKVVPGLVDALRRLDYPAAKLDIKLILEAADDETLAAVRGIDLPGTFEIVIVPDLEPRTKPKALNYALPLARGEYLVIFDASAPAPADRTDALLLVVDLSRGLSRSLAVRG